MLWQKSYERVFRNRAIRMRKKQFDKVSSAPLENRSCDVVLHKSGAECIKTLRITVVIGRESCFALTTLVNIHATRTRLAIGVL